MGKTNVPFNCADFQTYNDIHGTTHNPWNLTLTSGGASGGSGAAVASGMSPADIGTDDGGSIRVPASFCGVYAYVIWIVLFLLPCASAIASTHIIIAVMLDINPRGEWSQWVRPGAIKMCHLKLT